MGDVGERVGLHYGKTFDAESSEAKDEWIRRDQEARQQSSDPYAGGEPSAKTEPVADHSLPDLLSSYTR